MKNICIAFVTNQVQEHIEHFSFSDNAFALIQSSIFNNLPLINKTNSFSIKSENSETPVIGISAAFLIKNSLANIVHNEAKCLCLEDSYQYLKLLNKFETIFNRGINSYYSPNIFSGAFTLSIKEVV